MIETWEDPIFYGEDDIDYCTIEEGHCHEYEDVFDVYGTCVPYHKISDGCIECDKRYN